MRIKLDNGATANVSENCPKETIEALNEVVKKAKELEEYPCYNCQGGGCPVCGGWGVIKKQNFNMENEVENKQLSRNDGNTVLSVGIISAIADEYEEQVRLEKLYREDKKQKIKELEQLINNSINKPIYKLIYKPEYGDYRQFVEEVAKELRCRNACR